MVIFRFRHFFTQNQPHIDRVDESPHPSGRVEVLYGRLKSGFYARTGIKNYLYARYLPKTPRRKLR